MDDIDQTILSMIKIKTFETEKKAWAFNENLTESLKKRIMVKLYCSLIHFFNKFLTPKVIEHEVNIYVRSLKGVWVKPYCPWYNFLNKFLKIKKYMNKKIWKFVDFVQDPWKDNMSQTVMSQMQFFSKRLNTKNKTKNLVKFL